MKVKSRDIKKGGGGERKQEEDYAYLKKRRRWRGVWLAETVTSSGQSRSPPLFLCGDTRAGALGATEKLSPGLGLRRWKMLAILWPKAEAEGRQTKRRAPLLVLASPAWAED